MSLTDDVEKLILGELKNLLSSAKRSLKLLDFDLLIVSNVLKVDNIDKNIKASHKTWLYFKALVGNH